MISICDPVKHRGILLSREVVKDIIENESFYSARLVKMMQNRSAEEEIMRELPDGIVLRIGMFKEQLRADIRETGIKDGNVIFLQSGVNVSIFNFLQILRKLKEVYTSSSSSSPPIENIEEDDEDISESQPPSKKPKQTLSKNHHPKEAKGAKSFRKGTKGMKRKTTVVTSDDDSN